MLCREHLSEVVITTHHILNDLTLIPKIEFFKSFAFMISTKFDDVLVFRVAKNVEGKVFKAAGNLIFPAFICSLEEKLRRIDGRRIAIHASTAVDCESESFEGAVIFCSQFACNEPSGVEKGVDLIIGEDNGIVEKIEGEFIFLLFIFLPKGLGHSAIVIGIDKISSFLFHVEFLHQFHSHRIVGFFITFTSDSLKAFMFSDEFLAKEIVGVERSGPEMSDDVSGRSKINVAFHFFIPFFI